MKNESRFRKEKKSWKRPTVRSQPLHERNALACGKVRGTFPCIADPRGS